jgi:hypothetical protein
MDYPKELLLLIFMSVNHENQIWGLYSGEGLHHGLLDSDTVQSCGQLLTFLQ